MFESLLNVKAPVLTSETRGPGIISPQYLPINVSLLPVGRGLDDMLNISMKSVEQL